MAAPLNFTRQGAVRLSSTTVSSSPSSSLVVNHRRYLSSRSHKKAQVQSASRTSLPANHLAPPISEHIWNPSLDKGWSSTYFESTTSLSIGFHSEQPQDPNKVKLGKSSFSLSMVYLGCLSAYNFFKLFLALRILQDRLPTLLQSPLPQEVLSPDISLQLFPSTHPHLPTVSGRVAYNAALWTSPIAWNRVPIIGNVKLEILAERMTSEPLTFLPRHPNAIPDQLVVRWCEKRRAPEEPSSGIARSLRFARGADPSKAFTGLFIFDFDREGRILTHTIEQIQESGNWEKGMGAKFVGLTDWLLGGMRNPGDTLPAFAKHRR